MEASWRERLQQEQAKQEELKANFKHNWEESLQREAMLAERDSYIERARDKLTQQFRGPSIRLSHSLLSYCALTAFFPSLLQGRADQPAEDREERAGGARQQRGAGASGHGDFLPGKMR